MTMRVIDNMQDKERGEEVEVNWDIDYYDRIVNSKRLEGRRKDVKRKEGNCELRGPSSRPLGWSLSKRDIGCVPFSPS